MNIKHLSHEEFKKALEIDLAYLKERQTINEDSQLSSEEKRKRLEYLDAKHVRDCEYETSVDDDYVVMVDNCSNSRILAEQSKKYKGKVVIYSDSDRIIGELIDIVSMFDDFYYVINVDGSNRYCSCVGDIKLKEE